MLIARDGSRCEVRTKPEHRAAGAGEDGDGNGHRERFRPHAGRPWIVVDRVDPQRLQPESDRRHPEAADGTEDDGPLEKWRQGDQFDDDRGPEVEREPVDRCSEDGTHHQRHTAAQNDGQKRGDDRRAATQHDAGRDEAECRRCGDQHRLEHLAELRYAEIEFDLEHRQADEDAAEAEVLDELDAGTSRRSVVTHRLEPFVIEHDRREGGKTGAADHHQMGWPP